MFLYHISMCAVSEFLDNHIVLSVKTVIYKTVQCHNQKTTGENGTVVAFHPVMSAYHCHVTCARATVVVLLSFYNIARVSSRVGRQYLILGSTW